MTQDPNMSVPPPAGAGPSATVPDYAAPAAATTYLGAPPTKDDQTMGMLCHLLGIFTGFLGPLIIWLIKKDQSQFVDDQGKEALNWQLTLLIAWIVSGLLTFILVGFLLLPALFICNIIFCIMGTMKANQGIAYRYPFKIPFIK